MNFKRISHRISLCELKRLQSSLSASNSKIQIPTRIKRGPTDILQALESTIPKDFSRMRCIYHDDPFLMPILTNNYRNYGLSYESGKKTAMWIHKEHNDLFPKHLSDPPINAFQPPVTYTDKSQVSEELLLQVISQYRVSDALDIYRLLETNVSNQAKQALLELLCFFNNKNESIDELILERWYNLAMSKYVLQYSQEIDELYQFLIKQDSLTAAAAYNAMICGLARHLRVEEAWSIYNICKEKDLPINVTTYNYVLRVLPDIFKRSAAKKVEFVFSILNEMNTKKVKPNVRTLNSALKAVTAPPRENDTNDIIKCLFSEFQRINITFSLATYYYPILSYSMKDRDGHKNFTTILDMMKDQHFTIQDPEDKLFFGQAMHLANRFSDRKSGDLIHDLFHTGNNHIFLANAPGEYSYYSARLSLLLATSTIKEFFDHYKKIVPHLYSPQKVLFDKIINELKYNKAEVVAEYLPRLWSDLNVICQRKFSSMLACINLMRIDVLPPDSPLRTIFVDAAWTCWNNIKNAIEQTQESYYPVETELVAHIPLMLLHDKRIKEATEVLTFIVNRSDSFIPTMTEQQITELFNTFISEQCPAGAFLVLEYAANFGLDIIEMSTKLYNLPELTTTDRNKLLNLIGVETLNALDRPKSS